MSDDKDKETIKPESSSSRGLTVKLNGQKMQLPIQASTLAGMLAVGYQAFIGFHELQSQVEMTSDNVVVIAGKLDDLRERVRDLDEGFQALEPEMKALELRHEAEIKELEKEIDMIERCITLPERCDL